MLYVYTAIFTRREDGGYRVAVPDVPGCVTSGDDVAEALTMARDALSGCLCEYEDAKVELAAPRLPGDFELEEGSFAAMIDVDTLKYRAETDSRSIRKNVSIPAWMDTQAERNGLSLSQVLQDALREKLNG